MRRAGLALAAAIMAAGTLTACGGGGSTEEFCDLDGKYSEVDPTEDPDAAVDAMDEALDKAPDDIKGDIETLKDAMDELKDVDTEDPEAAAKAMEDIDQEKLQEASTNLQDWTDENCE